MNVGEEAGAESGSQTTAVVGFFFWEKLNSSEDRECGHLTLVSSAPFVPWLVPVCCRDKRLSKAGIGADKAGIIMWDMRLASVREVTRAMRRHRRTTGSFLEQGCLEMIQFRAVISRNRTESTDCLILLFFFCRQPLHH